MKKILCLATAFVIAGSLFAQSEKYMSTMLAKVPLVDSNYSADGWKELGNTFERIGDAEKTQWLPYYYAAYCNILAAYNSLPKDGGFGDNSATLDPMVDKAESLLNKAEALSSNNAEIYIVRKMVHGTRMMGNAMSRYMTEMPKATEALEKAKSLSPDNPRIYLLEAQDKFYTPEQYGGSKTEAKTLFEKSKALFDTFKPESPIAPNWGRRTCDYFLSQLQ